MPQAILNPDGTILMDVLQLMPSHWKKMPPGGRIVRYDPPPHDAETQTCTPVEPVPADAKAVTFVIEDKPDALDVLRARKLREIDAAFSAASQALLTGYPAEERLTWPTQQAEALAWQADANTPTPYLDGLAAVRGISAENMRQRTLEAVLAWMAESQQLVGRRQRLRDAAQAAPDKAALDALVFLG